MRHGAKVMAGLVLGLLLSSGPAVGQSKSAAAFDRLKSLAGEWTGTFEGITGGRMTVQVVSNGSAVLETMYGAGQADGMITVYHLDGDTLLATHYCAVGNQPRMRARPSPDKPNEISFAMESISNQSPGQEAMDALVVRFQDAAHFTQEWTSTDKGKRSTMVFHWIRKK